jgi:hypothetical protein
MFFKKPAADPYRDRYKAVRYRPVSKRRRLLIVLLAVATAATLLLYILGRRDAIHSHPLLLPLPADVSNCQGGKTTGCVGGMATVIMAPVPVPPPAPAASAR